MRCLCEAPIKRVELVKTFETRGEFLREQNYTSC